MYRILYKKSVDKDLRKLPKATRLVIVRKIQALARDPRPRGSVKLRGSTDLYRFRHTDYRVIYNIHDGQLVILIVKVSHRRDVYRTL